MAPLTEQRPDFEQAWRHLEPEVRRALRTAPVDVVEDVVQETGIKLMRVWANIDHDRPVAPFAVTVARNCLRDELRKLVRHAEVELPEELETQDDLDAQVSARIELAKVCSLLPRLTPGQRDALLGEVGGRTVGPDSPRVKMLRSRARVKLRELLASAGGFVTTRAARFRSGGHAEATRIACDVGILLQAALLVVIAGGPGIVPAPRPDPPAGRHLALHPDGAAEGRQSRPARHVSGAVTAPAAGSAGRAAPVPAGSRAPAPPGGGEGGSGMIPGVPTPSSKGRATDRGSFGPEGYDFAGGATSSAAGQDFGYRYEQRWESPDCVQRLSEGEPPGTCSAPSTPSGYVEVEAAGERHRVDLPEPPRRKRR